MDTIFPKKHSRFRPSSQSRMPASCASVDWPGEKPVIAEPMGTFSCSTSKEPCGLQTFIWPSDIHEDTFPHYEEGMPLTDADAKTLALKETFKLTRM
jgi:hypothetical protein